MMAAYAFEQPWDKTEDANAVCKIAEDVKRKIEREERDCKAGDSTPQLTFADCKDELATKIGDAVYNIVYTALKKVPFVNARKWAEKCRDKVKEVLSGKIPVSQIADIVASAIASFVPYVGALVKPLIKAAVQAIIKAVCAHSGCCDTFYYF